MLLATVLIATFTILATLGWLGRAIENNPRGDFETGVTLLLGKLYVSTIHALRVRGRRRLESLGADIGVSEPLIVVCNHTAGIDPVLVQAMVPFHIRWLMAQDMRAPVLEWFWKFWGIIFVDRDRRDAVGVRTALHHLKAGGVIGVFPEGALERPPKQLMPFQPGIGLLIRKSGARVLTCTIEDTPQFDPAWASLWHMSRSRIHFREILDYTGTDLNAQGVADDLRGRFASYLNWPTNDTELADYDAGGAYYGQRVSA